MKNASIAIAATAFAAFASSSVCAADVCYLYKDKSGGAVWNAGANWFALGDTANAIGSAPTASDNVFVYTSDFKANSSDAGTPLCVANGEVALTKGFTLGWNGSYNQSSNNKMLFEIQSGGVMTNSGAVKLGDVESGSSQDNPGGLATVRSGGRWVAKHSVTVGTASKGNRNRIVIEQGGAMEADSGLKEFVIANVAGRNACVTNAGALSAYDFFVGGYGNGDFENSGDFTVGRKFTIGRQAGSYGHVRHSGGTLSKGSPSTQPVHVGYNGTGVFEVFAPVSLQSNERLILGGTSTGNGTLVLGAGGSIGNVTNISVGAFAAGARGLLQMAGGTLTVQALASGSPYALLVGRIVASTGAQQAWGGIRGYGTIARSDATRSTRVKLYGQVVADGGDLNLGSIKTVGEKGVDANVCGSNGWYAVNGGRLFYPAAQDFVYQEHAAIGDYVYRDGGNGSRTDSMDITLVNSLQLKLYDANGAQQFDGNYNHVALYASDRADIPGTLPGLSNGDVMLGVWRIGHFDSAGDAGFASTANPVPFGKARLRFRIDSNAIPSGTDWTIRKVRLFRWSGSAWQVVGRAEASEMPYVETRHAQPAYAGTDADGRVWNVGWYAAALVRDGGFTIFVR